MKNTPKVSVILIAYSMSQQLENTLLSLAPDYQQGVDSDDYEVIVIENSSSDNLSAEKVAALPDNFRYLLRAETAVSPVYAVNEGFAMCRAPFICLMIDGARMVSPGIIRTALQAYAISKNAIVAIPGYHLGQEEQHLVAGSRIRRPTNHSSSPRSTGSLTVMNCLVFQLLAVLIGRAI